MFNEPYNANIPDNAGGDELANLANHHASNETIRNTIEDTVPAELQPLHQQLVTIGEEWRSLIPPADRLISYARNMEVTLIPPDADVSLDTTALARQTIDTAIGYVTSEPRFSSANRAENRFRLLVAVAVSLTMVALLAGVFAMFAPDRFAGKDSTTPTVTRATYTPTPRPTIGPVTGQWTTPPQLSNLPNEPVIAPSDSRIMYQGGAQLKRSDNGGATWRVIPTPSFSGGAVREVTVDMSAISTIDPNTVEISVIVGLSSSDSSFCPAGTQSPTVARDLALPIAPVESSRTAVSKRAGKTSFLPLQPQVPENGFIVCQAEYISRDGGSHWNTSHVPLDSTPPLGPNGIGQAPYLQAQGERLYGVKRVRPRSQTSIYPIGIRIMATTDATNWQLIDAPLLAQNVSICDIQATPTGSTIFALTFTFNAGCYTGGAGTSQIWRSDDAGAHWRLEGTFSTTAIAVRLIAVTPSDTGDWLLYATALENLHDAVHTYVSSDGGATWQLAPKVGLPAGSKEYTPMRGALADGSIVEAFTDAPADPSTRAVTLTFYAWRAGDSAWRRVSPPITIQEDWNDNVFLAIPGDAGRRNQLWIIASTIRGYALHRFDV